MKIRHLLALTVAFLLAGITSSNAQFGAPGRGASTPALNPVLAKAFGKITAFTAKAQMRVTDGSGNELMSGPVTYALSNGDVYWSMDMSKMKSGQLPPQAAASMKQMGMADLTTISKAGGKTYLLIYPGLKAYAELPLPGVTDQGKTEIKTEDLGEEVVDGHKCKKYKVTVTENGKSQEIHTWNATDLKDFPVRMEFADSNTKVQMTYSEIKFEKPDAKLFEPPAGFRRYDNMQQMLQTEMMKRMGGAQPPAPK